MNLYTSVGPNPRFVRLFMAEKGLDLPLTQVDIIAGENRLAPFLAMNATGTTPVLLLDSGVVLSESVAICEYLEDCFPAAPLIGTSPEEKALVRMWTRRVELAVVLPMTAGFRGAEGLGLFKDRVRCLPQAADDLKTTAREGLAWLDGQLGTQSYLVGERLTMADLLLFAFVEFGALVGQALDPANANLMAWHARMVARASALATA